MGIGTALHEDTLADTERHVPTLPDIVGTTGAMANVIRHATGKRIHSSPIASARRTE
jgi:hypothetical protein